MTWQRWTALSIVIIVVLVVVYDLIAFFLGGNKSTISVTILSIAQDYPGFSLLFSFAFGVLFGHLFLPQTEAIANDIRTEFHKKEK